MEGGEKKLVCNRKKKGRKRIKMEKRSINDLNRGDEHV